MIRRHKTPCKACGQSPSTDKDFLEDKLLVIILLIHLQVFFFPNKPALAEPTCNTASEYTARILTLIEEGSVSSFPFVFLKKINVILSLITTYYI